MRVYSFTVTGQGAIPPDMLRLDECYPAQGDDAGKINRPNIKGDVSVRSINLCSTKGPATEASWVSSGWTVTDQSFRDV